MRRCISPLDAARGPERASVSLRSMATTTQYGGAPLPELATRADALDALRRTGGGLADLQRRTQRAALGGALTFCFAGFAVLALTASPTYGPWNESPDAMETSGGVAARATLGPDDALARASSSSNPAPSSFARPAAAASFAARAEPRLGQVDSHALFEALLDAVTEAERPHLLQLLDGAQIMPDVIFQKFGELAASVAADEDGARATHMDTLVQKLNIMTDMDVTTAHLILHFRQNADVAEEEKLEPVDLAGFGTTVLAILRKYPEWSDEDARVITRATKRAEARARMNQNAAARAKTKADLGSVSGSGVSGSGSRPYAGWRRRDAPGEASRGALNGITPATRSRAPPLSEFASAPGLRRSVPSLGRSVTRAGVSKDESVEESVVDSIRASFDPESANLPRSFDARDAFPKCANLIGTVRDQGKCGSCWAVATVEVMNDRLCVASRGEETRELSPQYPLSCFASGNGCDGGDVVRTMDEVAERGVPHGGMLEGSESSCLPYEFEPCEHPCQVPGVSPAACPATCADGSELDVVKPKSGAYTCPSGDWACIAREIMTYGSVAVTFGSVHEDFYDYASGVYRVAEEDRRDAGLGAHATKLIGWGFEGDDPYWVMVNSWENWGDRGVGRVGVGEMNIESGVAALKM